MAKKISQAAKLISDMKRNEGDAKPYTVRVPQLAAEDMEAMAAKHGVKSMNVFILAAIAYFMTDLKSGGTS